MNNLLSVASNYATTKILSKDPPGINKKDVQCKTFLFYPQNAQRKGEGGLRKRGYFKHSYKKIGGVWYIDNLDGLGKKVDLSANHLNYNELPLITIITVVFNNEEYIEKTIQSVINQTYPNVEYIIIDGGSTDRTLDIIKEYENYVDYWVSERDRGIYDGMNKGIDLACGKWLNFMNSGDEFYDENTLEKIFSSGKNMEEYDVIYGDVELNYEYYCPQVKNEIVKAGITKNLWKGPRFCHQSAFIKVEKHSKFDIYNPAADFEIFYKMQLDHSKFRKENIVISRYLRGGFSQRKRYIGRFYCFKTVFLNSPSFTLGLMAVFYYSFSFLSFVVKDILKYLLPRKVLVYLMSVNNRYRNKLYR